MSATILQRVEDFLTAAGHTTGYTIKFFRWTDKDIAGTQPFICLRALPGSGLSNELVQEVDVLIQVVQTVGAGKTKALDDLMEAIMATMRGTTTPTSVVRISPVGQPVGPLHLENKRPYSELTVRCVTEDR